ncbi:ribosomal RNA processing 15 homolog S homeolog [Xenopus laevis]|uniref:RRP15-like protein n=1 Tax=Xenopus laevis TaxID=8355 RepID=Q5XFZ7_XENLA|nr:ribosomal RNA processing 15 homolog S homeolog [Xenopus laevis]AAH84674.1 LOC495250 protein [Xenopus laevis]
MEPVEYKGSDLSSEVSDGGSSSDGNDESDHEDEVTKDDQEFFEDENANKGWADAMAKILNKKVSERKATAILVKSKALEKEKLEKQEKKKQFDTKRQWEMMCRVKPDVVKDKETERNMQRIATRGVVQLFNAVRTHQSNVNDKLKDAGRSERKRSKLMSSVSKRDFIDVLRGKESKGEQTTAMKKGVKKVTVKAENEPGWNILRDDFMMGASMKDWDKDSDNEEGGEATGPRSNQDDSGSDSDR